MSIFSAPLLGAEVNFYECDQCGYVQTEMPSWLDKAYESAINSSDTGIMQRNRDNTGLVLATLLALGGRRRNVVDWAGGHGILVRMLRDLGVCAYWSDPYASNIVARGFEYSGDVTSVGLVGCFEAYEHFIDPVSETRVMLGLSDSILFTTSLIATPAPLPSDWWYSGLEHGQHIGFFRVPTLEYIASKLDVNLYTDGRSIHLFTRSRLSENAWKMLTRVSRVSPRLLSMGMNSLIWSDHVAMSCHAIEPAG